MRRKKSKRMPFGKSQNFPNTGDIKGRRLYVTGTVNQVKRELNEAGITFKKVRHSGYDNMVEIVYTQQGRHGPASLYLLEPEHHCRITSPKITWNIWKILRKRRVK